MAGTKSRRNVLHEQEDLRDDQTVERVVGNTFAVREVGDDRGAGVALEDVEDVGLEDVTTESRDVLVAGDLERATTNVGGVLTDELPDVDPIEGSAAARAPRREGRRPTKLADVAWPTPRRIAPSSTSLVHLLAHRSRDATPELSRRLGRVHGSRPRARFTGPANLR